MSSGKEQNGHYGLVDSETRRRARYYVEKFGREPDSSGAPYLP